MATEMVREKKGLGLLATVVLILGCGGSSDGSPPAMPNGGGGTVADYVGSYLGTYYDVTDSPSGTSAAAGTLAITVSGDGTVVGTRHHDATGADTVLAGVINADGELDVSGNDGGSRPIRLGGSLVKRSSEAVVTLGVFQAPSLDDAIQYARLTGGSATAGFEPRTTGKPWVYTGDLVGAWSRPEASVAGALSLRYAQSGRVTGRWTDADGAVWSVGGFLHQGAAAFLGHYNASGRLTLSRAGAVARPLDVRVFIPRQEDLSFSRIAGTAVEVGGDGTAYALLLNVQFP